MAPRTLSFTGIDLVHLWRQLADQTRATRIEDRPAALSTLISFMLGTSRFHGWIDPAEVGAFGFPAGGFTVLAAAGGRPDLARVAAHCAAHPAFEDCSLLASHPRGSGGAAQGAGVLRRSGVHSVRKETAQPRKSAR